MAVVLAAVVTGLYGTVSRGPITPTCEVGLPCSAPAPGVRLTFMRDGRAMRSIVTSATGRYRVELPPGSYAVRITKMSPIERLKPTSATVRRGVMAHRNFSIDTGIR